MVTLGLNELKRRHFLMYFSLDRTKCIVNKRLETCFSEISSMAIFVSNPRKPRVDSHLYAHFVHSNYKISLLAHRRIADSSSLHVDTKGLTYCSRCSSADWTSIIEMLQYIVLWEELPNCD
jgi:hypothetical protein